MAMTVSLEFLSSFTRMIKGKKTDLKVELGGQQTKLISSMIRSMIAGIDRKGAEI